MAGERLGAVRRGGRNGIAPWCVDALQAAPGSVILRHWAARIRDINPALYALGRLGSSVTLHDITSGNNAVSEPDATDTLVDVAGFNAGRGWDATTGLGTPKANVIVPFLAAFGGHR